MDNTQYLKDLSKCVLCGSCKALCPVYDEQAMESMGTRGRLALLWALASGDIHPSSILNDCIFSCTLCGACSGLCPPGIDIKEVIYHGRRILKKSDKKRKYIRFLTKIFFKNPGWSFRVMRSAQQILFPYLVKKGLIPFKPEMPEYCLKDSLQVISVSQKKGRVAVFTGCTVNFLYPHLGEALINVLNRLGYEVILPAGEVCCGAPLRALGLEDEAMAIAKKNLAVFGRLNVDAILSLCPTCTLAIKKEYPKLVGQGIDNAEDISTFFIDKLKSIQPRHIFSGIKNPLFHDPCHLKYGLGISDEPREIIKYMGYELIENDLARCCGFAGIFCFSNQQISTGLLGKCTEEYMKKGADAIITSCPGCMIQLSKTEMPVLHLIDIIERYCREPDS
jgi:glycolate oxidase iron-sulfur subunit